jgi:hypothetical protein
MDQKKVNELLLKIASNQQKIINKLAQQHLGDPSAPPPQSLPAPAHPELQPGKVVMNALPPTAKPAVKDIQAKGNVLEVSFNQPSQAALDAVTQTVQKLLNAKPPLLPFAYTVKAV